MKFLIKDYAQHRKGPLEGLETSGARKSSKSILWWAYVMNPEKLLTLEGGGAEEALGPRNLESQKREQKEKFLPYKS